MYSRKYSLKTIALSLVLLLGGCKVGGTAPHTKCCCKTGGGGIFVWAKEGSFCASVDSVLDCQMGTVVAYQWPSQSCPYANQQGFLPENGAARFAQSLGLKMTFSTTVKVLKENTAPRFASADKALPHSPRLNCPAACADLNSYLCQKIPSFGDDSLNDALAKLASEIAVNVEGVKKSRVMEIFSVKEDPCERSDTTTADGELLNSGLSCSFLTEVKFSNQTLTKAKLLMPANLKGRIKKSGGSQTPNIQIIFNENGARPILELEKGWNEDFGGPVRAIDYSNSTMIMETTNGCLAFD